MKKNKKIIILGGSGCGMGINSYQITDSLKMPTYNTGTHAGLGLKLQFDFFANFIKNGDIIIFIPEYQQFYKNKMYGDETAIRIMLSTYPQGIKHVNLSQLKVVVQYIPKAFQEWIQSLFIDFGNFDGPYSAKSLNKYGDSDPLYRNAHGNIPTDIQMEVKDINSKAISYFKQIKKTVNEKGAIFILLPPAYQDSSYIINEKFINEVSNLLIKEECPFHTKTEHFKLRDSLFFDSPYHLNLDGTIYRTNKLITEINK